MRVLLVIVSLAIVSPSAAILELLIGKDLIKGDIAYGHPPVPKYTTGSKNYHDYFALGGSYGGRNVYPTYAGGSESHGLPGGRYRVGDGNHGVSGGNYGVTGGSSQGVTGGSHTVTGTSYEAVGEGHVAVGGSNEVTGDYNGPAIEFPEVEEGSYEVEEDIDDVIDQEEEDGGDFGIVESGSEIKEDEGTGEEIGTGAIGNSGVIEGGFEIVGGSGAGVISGGSVVVGGISEVIDQGSVLIGGGLEVSVGCSGVVACGTDEGSFESQRPSIFEPSPPVCPLETVPIVTDVTMTQYTTEYITIPQPVTEYRFTTLPKENNFRVTNTLLTTVRGLVQTGLITSTRIRFTYETVTDCQIIPLTRYITHTEIKDATKLATSTITYTDTLTQTSTYFQPTYVTVIASSFTKTVLATSYEQQTLTETSTDIARATSVTNVEYPVYITTTELTWVPQTVTKTLHQSTHKNVWKTCGGY